MVLCSLNLSLVSDSLPPLFSTGRKFLGAGEEVADGSGTNQTETGGRSEAIHGLSEGPREPEGRTGGETEKVRKHIRSW